MPGQRTIDDISYWIKAFMEFGIDVRPITGDYFPEDQYSLGHIDGEIEEQMQRDAEHQRFEWIIRDRAYEAFGLVESDGPGKGVDGTLNPYRTIASNTEDERPFINLIKGNVDRVVSQLELTNLGIQATPINPDDRQAVSALNDLKDNILEDNNFEAEYQKYIRDGVQFGSGFMAVEHGELLDSPDLAMYINKIMNGHVFDQTEYAMFKRAIKGHKIEYVPTFEMIRYRGAKGKKGRSVHNSVHRWIHRVQHLPLAEVKRLFPEYADNMSPSLSKHYTDTNPYSYYRQDIEDCVTVKKTWIRFRVENTLPVAMQDALGDMNISMENYQRHAIAQVTRIDGLGVVDIDIDLYHHNRFPFVNWVYSDSFRHSCGIGIVKYGRDPIVVHNMLHNGMLEWFGTSTKGGGFVDSRLGLTEDDLNKQRKPGRYIQVDVPDEFMDKTVKDFIVDNRPPTFPSVYADLMSIEANAIDESMNVPNVSKGIKSGSSGLQEQVLQQQADMAHSSVTSALQQSLWPLGIIVYSNIQQFEKDPLSFAMQDPATGQERVVEINMPKGWYFKYNPMQGRIPDYMFVDNDISNLMYKVRISTKNIVPDKPLERANFMNNFFMQTAPFISDPIARAWLKAMNKFGYQIPGVDEELQRIDQMQQESAQQQMQAAMQQQMQEQEENERDALLERRDQDIDREKNLKDHEIETKKLMLELMKIMKDFRQDQASQKLQNIKSPLLQN